MDRIFGIITVACVLGGCGGARVTATAPAPAHSISKVEARAVDIPPGHMPPPGHCRIWYPGEPPGHQPPAGKCSELERSAPSGAWMLYRPDGQKRVVRIR